ncbi:MAG TPA: hypothetical protein VHS52_02965 [Acidimicrobiales bacterium]|jgi:hypothetical protein|nr:hypothetical protein [Acidimicrobiales bacterium]
MTGPGDQAPPEGGAARADRGGPGAGLRKASWWGTGAFTVTAAAAAVTGSSALLQAVAFAVAVALFLAGCLLFFAAYARGVARSRTDEVAVTTLYFLAGAVPPGVRRSLLGSLGVEVAVALATATARPYTSLAAGALVPMYGLGLCGLWSASHGVFPPRQAPARPPRRGSRPTDDDDEDPGSVNGS